MGAPKASEIAKAESPSIERKRENRETEIDVGKLERRRAEEAGESENDSAEIERQTCERGEAEGAVCR